MGSVRIAGALPRVCMAETAAALQDQLVCNAAPYAGISKARDAMLLPMIDLVAAAAFPPDISQASQVIFRRPFSNDHLRGRSTSDDARLFRSTLRNAFGLNDRSPLPTVRDCITTDAKGTPKRQTSWQALAEIRTPARSLVVCEGVIRRPRSVTNSERVVWVDHEAVGVAAAVTNRCVTKPDVKPVILEEYDTLEVLPGDYGYWQSQLATLW